jgi:hypothetical protein
MADSIRGIVGGEHEASRTSLILQSAENMRLKEVCVVYKV